MPPNTPSANISTETPSATISKISCACGIASSGTKRRAITISHLQDQRHQKAGGHRGLGRPDKPAVDHDQRGDEYAAHPGRNARIPDVALVHAGQVSGNERLSAAWSTSGGG